MKLLYFHTQHLKIKAGVNEKKLWKAKQRIVNLRKKLIPLPELNDSNTITTAKDALLVLICVERGDELLDLGKVKEDIIRAMALLNVQEIVMQAFSHLSNNAGAATLAFTVTQDVFRIVKEDCQNTVLVPFGWDKSLELLVPLHQYNVAFRSFSSSKENGV